MYRLVQTVNSFGFDSLLVLFVYFHVPYIDRAFREYTDARSNTRCRSKLYIKLATA